MGSLSQNGPGNGLATNPEISTYIAPFDPWGTVFTGPSVDDPTGIPDPNKPVTGSIAVKDGKVQGTGSVNVGPLAVDVTFGGGGPNASTGGQPGVYASKSEKMFAGMGDQAKTWLPIAALGAVLLIATR